MGSKGALHVTPSEQASRQAGEQAYELRGACCGVETRCCNKPSISTNLIVDTRHEVPSTVRSDMK